ncbi:MAG: hypothetical protein JW888_18505, partial [Pirellulales bacterium]|nr:hypothetical protein [Pirellulales bacterium]
DGWMIHREPIQGGCRLDCRHEKLRLTLRLDLISQGDVLSVVVPADGIEEAGAARLARLYLLPRFGAAVEGDEGYLVIPQQSGALCYFRDKKPAEVGLSVYQSMGHCPMPVFGLVRGDAGMAAIVTSGQHDARFRVSTNWGPERQYAIDPIFIVRSFAAEDRLPDDLAVEYHLLAGQDVDWTSVGKCYRQHNFARRGIRPLASRAAESPELDYSAQALQVRIRLGVKPVPYEITEQTPETEPPMRVFCTFAQVRDIFDAFHRQGIRHAEFCLVGWNRGGHDGRYPQIFPVEPALGGEAELRATIRHGQSLGYQVVAHDCYYGAYRISEDWSEDYLRKNPDGEPQKGGVWGGGQSYNICLDCADRLFAQRDLPRIRELGFRGLHYSDVLTITGPHACYDPKHPQTRRQDAEAAGRILALAQKLFGGAQSEGPFDFAAASFDRVLYVDCDKWSPLSKKIYVDACVPLYEVVYHGVLLYNLSTNTVNCLPGEDGYLKSIDYGAAPLAYFYGHFMLNKDKNWLGQRDYVYESPEQLQADVTRLRRVYDDLRRLAYLQKETLDRHRPLADGVFETTYGNGHCIVVNYNQEPHRLPSGQNVPPRDFVLVEP